MNKLHNDVTEGLGFLHAHDLIHTDIKPENILVCGEDKRLKILKEKLDEIKFKEIYDKQIENFKKKFTFTNKKDKDKFRKGKRQILLQIVDELAKILNVKDIYDNLSYLDYSEEELLNCTFKLADLGTIHSYQQMEEDSRFPCIQTRYYRAPRVLLKLPYDHKVDYWSLCAMYYELVEDKIMFNPHHTKELSTDQVHLFDMVQWIGNPDMSKISEPYLTKVLKKYFLPNGDLKFTILNRSKPELIPSKWDNEVLEFFISNMKWSLIM
jgi:serine/threonine protein kinase